MICIYGLKNCDSCRKAIKWLSSNNIEYKFFNLKDNILSKSTLMEWINVHSLEKIINKKSTTWRNLDDASKNQLDTNAVNIIIDFPSGLNLGAKVIPGNVPRSSCLFVSKFKT